MRKTIVLFGALLALGGCPLPQNLAEISSPGSVTVTPPRIVNELAVRPDPTALTFGTADLVISFDPTCPANQTFAAQVKVADESNVEEVVDYRWFVDYPAFPSAPGAGSDFPIQQGSIPPNAPSDPNRVLRDVPSPSYPPAALGNQVHVLELVVSNGFDPSTDQSTLLRPYRTPLARYEVQTYRWVFEPVPGSAGSTSPPCP